MQFLAVNGKRMLPLCGSVFPRIARIVLDSELLRIRFIADEA